MSVPNIQNQMVGISFQTLYNDIQNLNTRLSTADAHIKKLIDKINENYIVYNRKFDEYANRIEQLEGIIVENARREADIRTLRSLTKSDIFDMFFEQQVTISQGSKILTTIAKERLNEFSSKYNQRFNQKEVPQLFVSKKVFIIKANGDNYYSDIKIAG